MTTIDFDLDAIDPQSGSDGWPRTARMVILTREDETRVWTEECVPGGGFPALTDGAHSFPIPLGVDYRPLANDKGFRGLIVVFSDDLDNEARERVLAAIEDHVTDLACNQGLPGVWDAHSWLFGGDGIAIVLADVIAAGSIAEYVDSIVEPDVVIGGGRDALISAIRDAAEDLLRMVEEEIEDGYLCSLCSPALARAALKRLTDGALVAHPGDNADVY